MISKKELLKNFYHTCKQTLENEDNQLTDKNRIALESIVGAYESYMKLN